MALTYTSYIVLGLLEHCPGITPYELKGVVAQSVGNFWSVPHTQVYTEPARLAAEGYLKEERETGGRRRKRYTITAKGKSALREWVASPTSEFTELRDPGLLQLWMGADPVALGKVQAEVHRRRLEQYLEIRDTLPPGAPPGPAATLESGIGHEREWVRFWERLARDGA